MSRCEDYPCCGHAAGECPSTDKYGRQRWTCTECGRILPYNASSSICKKCLKRTLSYVDRYGGPTTGYDGY
jgi:hypothetical protein